MEDLFRSYWWLLFPLAFFVMQGWSSFMNYKRDKAKIELLRTYAASGKEPPANLIASLDRSRHGDDDWTGMNDDDSGNRRSRGGGGGSTAFLFILFGGLSAVFAVAGYYELFGREMIEFYFVSAILGVLAVAFLVSGMFGGRRGR